MWHPLDSCSHLLSSGWYELFPGLVTTDMRLVLLPSILLTFTVQFATGDTHGLLSFALWEYSTFPAHLTTDDFAESIEGQLELAHSPQLQDHFFLYARNPFWQTPQTKSQVNTLYYPRNMGDILGPSRASWEIRLLWEGCIHALPLPNILWCPVSSGADNL